MRLAFVNIFFLSVIGLLFSQDLTSDNSVQKNKPLNGWEYYVRGEYQKSIDALIIEKRSFPERSNIYVIMAWDYRELGKFADMEEISKEGLKLSPTDIRMIRNLAESYFFQAKYGLALDEFSRYLTLRTTSNDNYNHLIFYYIGKSHMELKNYMKADIALATSLYHRNNYFPAIITMALVKEKINEIKDSIVFFTEALRVKPNDKDALEGLNRVKNIN